MIVLCLILDSRQNEDERECWLNTIVLCLILDSRQNQGEAIVPKQKLYCALFWIQGKTLAIVHDRRLGLYCALFWIQGKTAPHDGREGS